MAEFLVNVFGERATCTSQGRTHQQQRLGHYLAFPIYAQIRFEYRGLTYSFCAPCYKHVLENNDYPDHEIIKTTAEVPF